jgi:dTDP-4-amino-4,6-dideoxygalactose transaminase
VNVRQFDGGREFEPEAAALLAAAERVLRSGQYVVGDEVAAFEAEFADRVGGGFAVSCASGTDALWLALRGAGVEPGQRVVTTPFTFVATGATIINLGAVPVFVDVDDASLMLDAQRCREVLAGPDGGDVQAVVPVHLFGAPAPVHDFPDGVPVVEDAAQAFGTLVGSHCAGAVGLCGAFSFFPTKNLGGFGDGGVVFTRDASLADRLRRLRAHGASRKYYSEEIGTNSRLDALQAALLRVRLATIEDRLKRRAVIAENYDSALAGIDGIRLPWRPDRGTHSFNQYVIRVVDGRRDHVQSVLRDRGVETAVYYPVPLHLQPAFAHLGYRSGDFPNAERATTEVLALPMYPTLDDAEIAYVAEAVAAAVR